MLTKIGVISVIDCRIRQGVPPTKTAGGFAKNQNDIKSF
jgi:hypothetical protein